jgi:hypothetical protein
MPALFAAAAKMLLNVLLRLRAFLPQLLREAKKFPPLLKEGEISASPDIYAAST